MLTVKRYFPLRHIHKGAELGNGYTGEMIWGEGNILNITLGCANLWDHRGGMEWEEHQSYQAIRERLKAGDLQKVNELFAAKPTDTAKCPSLIPAGRLVITLPGNAELLRYEQEIETGCTRIFYEFNNEERVLEFHADMTMKEAISGKGLDSSMKLKLHPAFELCDEMPQSEKAPQNGMVARGFQPPEKFTFGNGEAFFQAMPADPSYALLYRRDEDSFTLSFRRNTENHFESEIRNLLSFEEIAESSRNWWKNYWTDIPVIKTENAEVEEVYYHGLYKYGIITNPAGVTPGLQGPWIEDNMLPPWSGDYHFNINVQLCNMPGLKAGKFENLKMLFDMVLSWKEKLRKNAKCFLGIDNGYMLPHAVDDRGVCMGGFWTGSIDHACSAWVAMMMADYCKYSGDSDFLENEVYDFMCGVMRVYYNMLDEKEDGTLELPVSISPEYRGSTIDSWGKNASFQLAALHRLNRELLETAQLLGKEPDPSWLKIEEKLPKTCLVNGEIALWDGLLIERSHRHHSHLAGLCPFDVIDPLADEWKKIVEDTLERWFHLGWGEWAGWSMGWASQIHTRIGNGGSAELLIKLWKECFTNEGGGSQHDAVIPGLTIICRRQWLMQIDGFMGALAAVQDQFLHAQNGIIRVFFGVPDRVRNTSFERMFAPGGFRISGTIEYKKPLTIKVEATRDALLKIQTKTSQVFEQNMKKGETLILVQKENMLITL